MSEPNVFSCFARFKILVEQTRSDIGLHSSFGKKTQVTKNRKESKLNIEQHIKINKLHVDQTIYMNMGIARIEKFKIWIKIFKTFFRVEKEK